MSDELSVIVHLYDFILWMQQHLEKFPRRHQFGIGRRLEGLNFDLLDLLLEAKFSRDKVELLRRAALRIEQARFSLRLCKDLRILAIRSHHFACQRLDEIGREIGGWRKQSERHG